MSYEPRHGRRHPLNHTSSSAQVAQTKMNTYKSHIPVVENEKGQLSIRTPKIQDSGFSLTRHNTDFTLWADWLTADDKPSAIIYPYPWG